MNERDIFLAAIDIADPAQRAAYLDQACHGHADLRAQVQELLKAHAESSQFLETPAAATAPVVDQTIQRNTTDADDHSGGERSPGEVEFLKYLKAADRPGWLGRLAHYEIENILGRGAFGIVAKAFDEKLHRAVAIKLMSPELASTSPPRKRFLREARTAAAVTHENIVAIHAVEEEPIPYLVMEYISGRTLQQQMDGHGPLEVPEVLRIGQQVAAGLAAAHAANLIHRDIKPANILLADGPNLRAKISDFGLARAVDDATMTSSGLIAGTPMYMAPEQARGETLDHRADLFSLGCVLYQMAGGRPPFRASNTVAVLKRVCEDTPRPLGDVLPGTPGWLEAIIFKLLEKEPDNRFQSAREVADLLARCQRELEHHGQVTCVEGRLDTAEMQLFQANKPAGSGSKKQPLGRLIGGVVAVTAVIGLLRINSGKESPAPESTSSSGNKNSAASIATPANPTLATAWQGWPADAPKPAIAPFDAEQANAHQEAWAKYLGVPVEYTNSIGMKFRLIPPGEFLMGSTREEIEAAGRGEPELGKQLIQAEYPKHRVVLTQPFYLAVTEVSQGHFAEITGGNPSKFSATGAAKLAVDGVETTDFPVEWLSWAEATGFCIALSQREEMKPAYFRSGTVVTRVVGAGYRLPTEAEWEFACRAGSTTQYSSGDSVNDIRRVAWLRSNSSGRTHAVGELPPNSFGLFDLHGNVWEWVEDGYDSMTYSKDQGQPAIDPLAELNADHLRVIRGGNFHCAEPLARSAHRRPSVGHWKGEGVGMRVALPIASVKSAIERRNSSQALQSTPQSRVRWRAADLVQAIGEDLASL